MLPLELLQILACPACKGELLGIDEGAVLRCPSCNKDYPVVDGVPVLLAELATTVISAGSESP